MSSWARATAFGSLLALVLLLPAGALRAATSTDDFASSRSTLDFTVFGSTVDDTGSNVGATLEAPEEPVGGAATSQNSLSGSHSKWWTIEVDGSGPVEINTTGSDFDTILYVFTGTTLGSLFEVAANDDASGSTVSSCVLFENSGNNQVYHIAVHGFGEGDVGNINLQIKTGDPLPANDDILDKEDLVGRAIPLTYPDNVTYPSDPLIATNKGATLQSGEPDSIERGGTSVWYRWKAPATGWYEVDTRSSDFDTVLYLFEGTAFFNLSEIAANDDDHSETTRSRIAFEVTSTSQEYRIAVHGWNGSIGNLVLKIKSVAPPPLNDNFADAKPLLGLAVESDTVDNTGATTQSLDPDLLDLDPFGASGASVWWCWDPTVGGRRQVNTALTGFDTSLYVFRSNLGPTTNINDLVYIGGSDDANGTTQSEVNFDVGAGPEVFYFAAHGFGGATGPIQLEIKNGFNAPANDLFANAIDLGIGTLGSPLRNDDTNLGASREPNEPRPLNAGSASIWYTWTSPATPGRYRIDTAGSTFDTLLYVFKGGASGGQVYGPYDNATGGTLPIQPDCTTPLVRTFNVTEGFTVDDLKVGLNLEHDARGDLRVQLTSPEATTVTLIEQNAGDKRNDFDLLLDDASGNPVNDNDDDNTGSPTYGDDRTAGPDNPLSAFDGELATGTWTLSICNTDFTADGNRTLTFNSAQLQFTGTPPDLENLKAVAVDDHSGGTLQAAVDFNTAASKTYYLAVHGRRGLTGLVDLSISASPTTPPANDDLASVSQAPVLAAADLGNSPSPPPILGLDTTGATVQEGEQDDHERGGASVWFRWQAPSGSGTTRKSVSTLGSDYGTLVYVYEDFAGQIERLKLVGFSNETGGTRQSLVNFDAFEDTVYYIAVHGDFGETGLLDLVLGAGIAAPVNDNFTNGAGGITATDLGTTATPAPVTGFSTAGASLEIGEPNPLGNGGASVWYCWSAPAAEDGNWFQLDTLGSNYDTVLSVFTGATTDISSFIEVATNEDDAGNISQSRLNLQVVGGMTYHIAIHGFLGDTGNLNLNIAKLTTPPPANDRPFDGVGAVTLNGLSFPLAAGSNEFATLQAGETDPLGLGGRSMWYCWSEPAGPGTWYEFDTLGSIDPLIIDPLLDNALDTLVYAFEDTNGTLAGLLPIDANDDDAGDTAESRLNFFAEGGKTYYFAVHGFFGAIGELTVSLTAVATPPLNDDLANPTSLGGGATAFSPGNNTGATLEGTEADPLDDGGASIWYSWTAPSNGSFAADTFGGIAPIDTVLYVFSSPIPNPGHGDLNFIGASDAANGTQQSRVTFDAVGGTKYFFAVHGDEGEMGAVEIAIGPGIAPPANDAFASPTDLGSAAPVAVTADTNNGATLEAGEPVAFGDGGASIWYLWSPPSSDTYTVGTLGSNFDTRVHIFEDIDGTIANLLPTAANNDGPGLFASQLTFPAVFGKTYYIAIHGDSGDTGAANLQIDLTPANDDFSGATNLVGTTVSTSGSNAGATIEPLELVDYGVGGSSVWYSWTAPGGGGTFDISTAGSDFDTRLYVYSGAGYGSLLLEASNDNAPGSLQSRLALTAAGGTTYWIAVHGALGATGSVSLQLTDEGPFGTWIAGYPLTGADALPFADPDGDRLCNLCELAFGLDPTVESTLGGADPNYPNYPAYTRTATHIQLFYTIAPLNLSGGAGSPIEIKGTWSTDAFQADINDLTPVSLGGNDYMVEIGITPSSDKLLGVFIEDPNP